MAMIPIGHSARLLLVVTALPIAAAAQVPQGQDDEGDEAEKQRLVMEQRQQLMDRTSLARIKQQFHQAVYGNGGSDSGAHRELEVSVSKRVDQIDRICTLTEAQKKKLLAAGRGDIKHFFDRVEDASRRLPEVHGNVVLHAMNMARVEALPLRKERDAILAGEGFFFKQALSHTFTEDQLGRFRKDLEDRKVFRHRAAVRWTVVMLARSLGLTDDQRRRFETLLLAETRPPEEFGVNDYQIVMSQAAKIPEARIRPIFDDLQWRILRKEFAVAGN